MILDRLNTLLRAAGIVGAAPTRFLQADLGMDFQERLCFREDVEVHFQVVIPDEDVETDLTVLEFAGIISRKLLMLPKQMNFGGSAVEDIAIMASTAAVFDVLRDISRWPRVFPDIRDVDVVYDDGLYQEFITECNGAGGDPVSVRFVRRCEPDHITYFQPTSWCFLKHYCGDWFIRPLAHNATNLTFVQRWSLASRAEVLFPAPAMQQVATLLHQQARSSLVLLKRESEDRIVVNSSTATAAFTAAQPVQPILTRNMG
jgi:hypothetical protein